MSRPRLESFLPCGARPRCPRYTPKLWEKWIHPTYFGRVYSWTEGLTVVRYQFEPHFQIVPRKTWYSADGNEIAGGGYSRQSKRPRTAVRREPLNLATDFAPKLRFRWEGNRFKVPDAKLFMDKGNSLFGR